MFSEGDLVTTGRLCGVKTNTLCEIPILCFTSINFMEIRTQLWNHYFSDKLPIKWINFTVLSVELIYLIQDMDKSKVFFFKYNKFQVK